jgi:hypothetical protein
MIRRFLCAVALAAASVTGALVADTSDDKSRVTLVYDQVLRADLIFKTFDVKTNRRLGEIYLARRFGKAAGVADGYEGS